MTEKKWGGEPPKREFVNIGELKKALQKPEEPQIPEGMEDAVPRRADAAIDPDDSGVHDIAELRRMAREASEGKNE